MANPKDLERALAGDNNLEGADLSGADLRGARLWKADLTGANLEGVNLKGVDLLATKGIPQDIIDKFDHKGETEEKAEKGSNKKATLKTARLTAEALRDEVKSLKRGLR